MRLAVAMAPRWLAILTTAARERHLNREKDMMLRSILVTVITTSCLCAMSTIAAAQDPVDPPTLKVRMTAPAGGDWQPGVTLDTATRGPALPGLYAALIGLQAYDGYSTSRGLKQGAVEANTFMSRIASHPGALWAAKGGAAFMSIYASERLWRQHRRGQAIALMVVSNGVMAAVAASNASVLRAQK